MIKVQWSALLGAQNGDLPRFSIEKITKIHGTTEELNFLNSLRDPGHHVEMRITRNSGYHLLFSGELLEGHIGNSDLDYRFGMLQLVTINLNLFMPPGLTNHYGHLASTAGKRTFILDLGKDLELWGWKVIHVDTELSALNSMEIDRTLGTQVPGTIPADYSDALTEVRIQDFIFGNPNFIFGNPRTPTESDSLQEAPSISRETDLPADTSREPGEPFNNETLIESFYREVSANRLLRNAIPFEITTGGRGVLLPGRSFGNMHIDAVGTPHVGVSDEPDSPSSTNPPVTIDSAIERAVRRMGIPRDFSWHTIEEPHND